MPTDKTEVAGMTEFFIEKLSHEIGDDRIIKTADDEFAYIDTELCAVFLVSVKQARFVAAAGDTA